MMSGARLTGRRNFFATTFGILLAAIAKACDCNGDDDEDDDGNNKLAELSKRNWSVEGNKENVGPERASPIYNGRREVLSHLLADPLSSPPISCESRESRVASRELLS